MVVTWTSLETPLEALAVAPPMPGMPQMGGMMGGLAGSLLQAMAAPGAAAVELPENLAEGVEGASGGVGGGLKLTGGARAALMSKLAATAGLDTSNVPQIPLPQAPQGPQVRRGAVFGSGCVRCGAWVRCSRPGDVAGWARVCSLVSHPTRAAPLPLRRCRRRCSWSRVCWGPQAPSPRSACSSKTCLLPRSECPAASASKTMGGQAWWVCCWSSGGCTRNRQP